MNLNKCARCGAFFATNNNVCPNCEAKDSGEISKLKNFLSENECPNSLESLSIDTGISERNLNRFLNVSDFEDYKNNINL